MKETIQELTSTETGASTVQGAAVSGYGLQPIQFLQTIVDAAKNQLFFTNFVQEFTAPEGIHDVVIPKRTAYEGRSGVQYDTSERTSADISWTSLDNLSSVIATPTPVLSGYAITNYALRTNSINLMAAARDELSYAIGDKLDQAIATAIGDATLTTSTVAGAQTLYGGDAYTDATLAAGDVITTDLIAKAARYLKQTKAMYWVSSTETLSSGVKNPWDNTNTEPFVFFIGPAQEEAFRKDSQFVNASEYGSNRVIMNGEIGEYLGIKIVTTNNVEQTASGTAPDGTTAAVAQTRCILMKAKRTCALVWGQKPTIKIFDYPNRDQTRISLICAYAIKVIHPDAIVFVDVSDI